MKGLNVLAAFLGGAACKYLELFTKTDNKSDKTTTKIIKSKNKKKIAKMC